MPGSIPNLLLPLLPACAAVLAAVLLRLAGRWRPVALVWALPAGMAVGALAVTLPFNLRALWAPRVMADHLWLVAAFGLLAAAARLRRRWVPLLALAMATGWWIAHTPPALPEFWRVGLAVTLYGGLLMRGTLPALAAGSLAGVVALWLAGAAPVWQMAMLVPAAACAAMLGTEAPAAAVAAFIAASATLASLAGGRAVTGRLTAVDLAALVPLVVALCWRPVMRRWPAWRWPWRGRPQPRVAVRRTRA